MQLKDDAESVEMELKSLLAYYGEVSDGNEGLKPEDFFGLVMSFSSALQVRLPSSFYTQVVQLIFVPVYRKRLWKFTLLSRRGWTLSSRFQRL